MLHGAANIKQQRGAAKIEKEKKCYSFAFVNIIFSGDGGGTKER